MRLLDSNTKGAKIVQRLAYQNSNQLLNVVADNPTLLRTPLKGDEGRTVPHILAFMGYDTLYKEVVEKHPDCVAGNLDRMGSHVLHYLVDAPPTLKWHLKQISNDGVNTLNKKGLTPLAYAIVSANYPSYRALLKAKADPNKMPITAEAALIVKYVSHQTLKWLKKGKRYGMNLSRTTALDAGHILEECLKQGKKELFRELIGRGYVDINLGGPLRKHPVFDIIKGGDEDLFQFGIEHGMKTDGSVRNASWCTPAHFYFRSGLPLTKKMTLRLLKGTTGDLVDGYGNTLSELVPEEFRRDKDISRLLSKVQKKSLPNVRIPEGSSSHPAIAVSSVYSASIDHVVFFLLGLVDRYPSQIYLPLSEAPIIEAPAFSSEDNKLRLRMKMRLHAIRELTQHMNMFIEYASPENAIVPQLPAKFPENKISVYLLSLVNEHSNHSNIVLVDTRHNLIERFDPEGRPEKELDDFVKNKVFHKHSNMEYKPVDGRATLQIVETSTGDIRPGDPVGFCTAHCCFYLEARAANPEVHPDKLMDVVSPQIMKKGIRKHIRKYSLALSHRRNTFLKSVLGGDSDGVNAEQFSSDESAQIRRYVDAWLQMIEGK